MRSSQLVDPQIHTSNADIVEADYDPWGGRGDAEQFTSEFYGRADPESGAQGWNWPDGDGAVPGTVSVRRIGTDDSIVLDRIGSDFGEYFAPNGTGFSELAVPADRLAMRRRTFTVDTSHPDIVSGRVTIEESVIAPAFGQPGGGTQVRLMMDDRVITSGQAQRRGLFGSEWR